jgi:hypothetical protein
MNIYIVEAYVGEIVKIIAIFSAAGIILKPQSWLPINILIIEAAISVHCSTCKLNEEMNSDWSASVLYQTRMEP